MRRSCRAGFLGGYIPGFVCLLLWCGSVQPASAQSAVTVVNNGDPANRVDLAILGDGYTSGEMEKYANDVQQVLDGLFLQQPFTEYQRYFNVHRVEIISSESGVDHPENNIYKNTALDAGYNCSGIQRLICVNITKVQTAASNALTPAQRDIILVIVNDPQYGGSGGSVAVVSTHPSVVDLVLHEEGHAFGLLGDEYGGPPPPSCNTSFEPEQANVTMQTQRDRIKWNYWIDEATPIPTTAAVPGIPGLYQGAQYCDTEKYRPTFNSKMRSLYQPFEQVNSEQLIKRIYNWVSPLDTSSPLVTEVTIARGQVQPFSVTTPIPLTHDLAVGWYVDGAFAGSGTGFVFDSRASSLGQHTVEAVVEDVTDLVRNDPAKVLREVQSWKINVREAAGLEIQLAVGGASSVDTPGIGPVLSGYAQVTVNDGPTPYGTAVFSLKQNGVVVSEAGVPASPPTKSARIFIDYRNEVDAIPARGNAGKVDINTGIAVVNLGEQTANVTYTLRESSGGPIAVGHGKIDGRGHLACFIDQLKNNGVPDFDLPADFQSSTQFGSLDIFSDQPLSVLALRGTTNQRGEFLITTTPVADLERPPAKDAIYFPQFVDGGGYTTSLILLNTSGVRESGLLEIRDKDGNPLPVTPAGGALSWTFRYDIEPGGLLRFQTDGAPDSIRAGWARLMPVDDTPVPAGSGVFGFNPEDVLQSESGIPHATATTHARVYVDLSARHNTGLAIAVISNTGAEVTINAFQEDGITPAGVSQGPIPLPAYGYTAAFADSFVQELPEGFTGVLDIISTLPVAALTLRSLVNERDEFLMTTFPVADANQDAPSPIIFPHIADGGGYITQFILLSPAGAATSTLRLYDNSGVPFDLAQ